MKIDQDEIDREAGHAASVITAVVMMMILLILCALLAGCGEPTTHDMTRLSGEEHGLWFVLDQPVRVKKGDLIIERVLNPSRPFYYDTVVATQDGWITHRESYRIYGVSWRYALLDRVERLAADSARCAKYVALFPQEGRWDLSGEEDR